MRAEGLAQRRTCAEVGVDAAIDGRVQTCSRRASSKQPADTSRGTCRHTAIALVAQRAGEVCGAHLGEDVCEQVSTYFLLAICAAVALAGVSAGVSCPPPPPYLSSPPCISMPRFDMMLAFLVLCPSCFFFFPARTQTLQSCGATLCHATTAPKHQSAASRVKDGMQRCRGPVFELIALLTFKLDPPGKPRAVSTFDPAFPRARHVSPKSKYGTEA